jgi:hypothetical protein
VSDGNQPIRDGYFLARDLGGDVPGGRPASRIGRKSDNR